MTTRLTVQQNNIGILDQCQRLVDAETTSRNLYWSRSVYWRGQGFGKLADYYLKQSQEEHAQLSADRMTFLGQQPMMRPEPVPAVSGILRKQFGQDIQVEANLAALYYQAISDAATAEDYVTEDIWRKVLAETEQHTEWLQHQLAMMDQMGDENYMQTWA